VTKLNYADVEKKPLRCEHSKRADNNILSIVKRQCNRGNEENLNPRLC
jgi:hypothetical protein